MSTIMHSKEIYNKLTNMESIVRPKTPSLNPASCVVQNKRMLVIHIFIQLGIL